jgi:hypothetical protein
MDREDKVSKLKTLCSDPNLIVTAKGVGVKKLISPNRMGSHGYEIFVKSMDNFDVETQLRIYNKVLYFITPGKLPITTNADIGFGELLDCDAELTIYRRSEEKIFDL